MSEQALEVQPESEALYHSLLDDVLVGLYRTTPDGQILYVNQALAKMLGYPDREAMLGLKIVDSYVEPRDRVQWQARLEREGVVSDFETQWRRHDGSNIWARESARVVRDADGQVLYYEGSVQDITARKQMEAALQERNRELAMLNRAGHLLNSTLDLDQVLSTVLEEVRGLLAVVACSVWLLDPEANELVCQQATGPRSEFVHGWRLAPGEGLAGWVALHGETLLVSDTRADPRHFKAVDQQTGLELRSILSIPLRVRESIIGVLQVGDTESHRFKPTDATLVESLATSAATAIEKARLYDRAQQELAERKRMEELLRRRLTELTVLHTVATAGAEATSLDALIERATEVIGETLYPDNFGVLLIDETAGVLRVQPSYRGTHEDPDDIVIPLGQGVTGRVAEAGRPWRVADVSREPAYLDVEPDMRSELCVPLKVGERVIGVINAESRRLDAFSADDERLMMTFAGQLATAIEKVRLFDQVQQLAITDSLTGLYNRRHFFELAKREFERARRYQRPLSMLMLDIDGFKRVNDTYGHAIGDQALFAVAERCRQHLRDVDLLGRYGGEEFAILLPHTDGEGAQLVAERLRQKIAQTAIDVEQAHLEMTVSIGVGFLDEECADLETLLDRADQALYAAKRAGRDCVRVWEN